MRKSFFQSLKSPGRPQQENQAQREREKERERERELQKMDASIFSILSALRFDAICSSLLHCGGDFSVDNALPYARRRRTCFSKRVRRVQALNELMNA